MLEKGRQKPCSLAAKKIHLDGGDLCTSMSALTPFSLLQLSELVRVAVEQNTLTMEPVASQTLPALKTSAEECGGPK